LRASGDRWLACAVRGRQHQPAKVGRQLAMQRRRGGASAAERIPRCGRSTECGPGTTATSHALDRGARTDRVCQVDSVGTCGKRKRVLRRIFWAFGGIALATGRAGSFAIEAIHSSPPADPRATSVRGGSAFQFEPKLKRSNRSPIAGPLIGA